MNKILIADDEEDMRTLYRHIVKKFGQVIEAKNGAEAVELYKKNKPDLTLMDIDMPVMRGDEAIKEIIDKDPEAKIIAVTGIAGFNEDLGVKVLKKGFEL